MSPQAKMEYLKAIYSRYKEANRKEKSIILNEFCQNCNYHRKYAIRKINAFKPFTPSKPKRRGKPSVYNKTSVIEPLKRIWLVADLPCSKRLKVILPLWLPSYTQEFGELSFDVIKALNTISPATIDRLLKPLRIRYRKHGRASTKPGTLLKKHIPIKTDQWDESRPGFLEADTVAHRGESLFGMFVYTIDCVDIATRLDRAKSCLGQRREGCVRTD